jgi:outer membrane receptor protein involved in Fe transport
MVLICWYLIATAQGVQGLVQDARTGEPLTGATIQAGPRATISDYDGKFMLSLIPGIYNLQISYVGYTHSQSSIQVMGDTFTFIGIQLEPSALILETTTVTSGRFERPLSETTVSLDILRPQFIENLNMLSIDEALNRLPGVNIIDGQANIRGGSGFSYGAGSRVMLLVDDIPALQADAGFPNWNDIPVENIEQVEVVKGAASSLFGTAAMNGIINVRTAFAKSKPVTKFSTFYTAYMNPGLREAKWWDHAPSTSGFSLAHREKFGKLDFAGSMFYVNTHSHIQDAFDEQGRITLNTRYRITDRLAVGMNANVNMGRSRDFFLWANNREGAYMGGGENNATESEKLRFFIDPYLTYFDKNGNRHKVLGRIYGIDNQNNLDQSNQSNLYYSEYQFQRHLVSLDMVMTAGVVHTWSTINAELYSDTTFTAQNAAAYVQLEKKFMDWLTLSGGLRYEFNRINAPDSIGGAAVDQSKNRDARPVMRFGANARVLPFTFLRASWGQGYRFPTIAEKYIRTVFGGFQVVPNLELGPETGWSAEVGLKQGVRWGTWNGFFDLALFYSEYRDMMEFNLTTGFRFQSQNIGNTVIQGVELAWNGQGTLFGKPLSMFAGYTFIEPRYKEFGDRERLTSSTDKNVLKYRFSHSVKLDVEAPVSKRFTLGYTFQFNSHMEAIDGIFLVIPGVAEFREENNKGFNVMDVRFGYRLHEKVELWAILKNALNEVYSMRPALLEEPRNITLRANVTL